MPVPGKEPARAGPGPIAAMETANNRPVNHDTGRTIPFSLLPFTREKTRLEKGENINIFIYYIHGREGSACAK